MNHAELLPSNRRDVVIKQVFDTLDVSETIRREYAVRIRHFLRFTDTHGLNRNSYLEYKRYLQGCETFSVSTKNKYLISAKVFLDGLHRVRLIPQKITDGVKGFSQSRLHKKDGLTDDDIGKLQSYCSALKPTRANLRLRAIIALSLRLAFVGSNAEQYDCNFPISSSVRPSFLCSLFWENPFTPSVIFCGISCTRYNPSRNTFAEIRYLFLVDTLNVSQPCK